MKSAVLILALACSSCATCNEHPTACAAITFVAVGCGTLLLHNHRSQLSHDVTTQPVNCQGSACL